LFYRISTISVHLPPLRDRQDDIMPLASAFLKRFAAQANRDVHGFKTDAIDKLNTFDWPGNVRQLQNEVQRAVLLCEDAEVSAADLSITHAYADSMPGGELNPDRTLLKGVERNTIIQTLKQTAGNKAEAAKRLGIGRPTLYHKLKVYGIDM
jgi:DNA-binding NtrC family response regulator